MPLSASSAAKRFAEGTGVRTCVFRKNIIAKFTSSGTFHLDVCVQKYTHIRVLGFILSRLILFLNRFLRKSLYSSLKVTLTYYFKDKESLAGGAYKEGYLNIIIQVEFKEELVDD